MAHPSAAGRWLAVGAGVVACAALAAVVVQWQRLDRIQLELARRSAEVVEQVNRSRELAERTEAQAQELQARLAVAEIKLSEVSLQRTQLEELMLSVSRSRDDTLVLDIESGLRLAMQQTDLTGSVQPLVSALIAADQRIARAAQPRLNPVQRAIGRDIDAIKARAVADLPALANQLDELARLVEDLPLLNAPPAPGQPETAAPRGKAAAVQPSDAALNEAAPPADAPPSLLDAPVVDPVAAASPWQSMKDRWQAFWDRTTRQVVAAGRDLVRVSRIHEPEAVLLSPDQSIFLRENLTLKLLNARLSLLSRQMSSARADLLAVKQALQKYFDPQAPATRKAVQIITEALQIIRSVDMPRPDDTLTALAAAAKGR